jgi:hypothetical protein
MVCVTDPYGRILGLSKPEQLNVRITFHKILFIGTGRQNVTEWSHSRMDVSILYTYLSLDTAQKECITSGKGERQRRIG